MAAIQPDSAEGGVEEHRSVKRKRILFPYSELLRRYHDGQLSDFDDRYSFDQIETCVVTRGADLERALNESVKVALDPTVTYCLTAPIRVVRPCYLIGNGAKIRVQRGITPAVIVLNSLPGPQIGGIPCATFHNVKFVGYEDQGVIMCTKTHTLLHGVEFINVGGTAVRVTCGFTAKGCSFVNCSRGLKIDGDYSVNIKYCSFENCTVAVVCKTDIVFKCNTVTLSESALLLWGSGVIKNNAIISCTDKKPSLLTCLGATVAPLATFHFVPHLGKKYPVFKENTMQRGIVFLGRRKGVFNPERCNFSYTHLVLDVNVGPSLCLWGNFDQSVSVCRIKCSKTNSALTQCECGSKHIAPQPSFTILTSEFINDPTRNTCHALDYSSDEED
ncbi:E1b_55K [Equine adenovirus 2]|uniref:E1B 55 kDa protein n=1 Tax=Equine adenovirus B serotype 2 TaxID=67603 RepID=A0A0K1DCG4_ADEE2|nr:E1b_55K [Equine adenovirus 2]AKT26018.1 E1b_55K [Equine adenovirus 2]